MVNSTPPSARYGKFCLAAELNARSRVSRPSSVKLGD